MWQQPREGYVQPCHCRNVSHEPKYVDANAASAERYRDRNPISSVEPNETRGHHHDYQIHRDEPQRTERPSATEVNPTNQAIAADGEQVRQEFDHNPDSAEERHGPKQATQSPIVEPSIATTSSQAMAQSNEVREAA